MMFAQELAQARFRIGIIEHMRTFGLSMPKPAGGY
jgi:hypothetical protein